MVTVQGDWHTPAADEACFEDGTLSFLQIPDLESGLSWINGIGMDLIHQRVTCLTGWFIDRLAALRHGNGEPMARIYGPANTRARGGTIAFNLLDPGGRVVDERAVARATAAAGISIRTGCFCNPGAGEGAFGLTQADWRRAARGRPARWTSTWTFSACRAAGRSAHPWAWPRTSTTSSDSSRSWS
jgi:selenocysteine lyase/cysteine desulfurase